MFDSNKFGMHLSFHRRSLGISLREASEQIGVSAATLSRIERGTAPDIDNFAKISIWAKWEKQCDFFFVKNAADLDKF